MVMETDWIFKHKKLVFELSEGMEKAQQLQQNLSSMYPCGLDAFLLHRIISCFENALGILNSRAQTGTVQNASMDSPVSANEVPRSYDSSNTVKHRDASKKRKLICTRKELVRVNSKNGLEGPSGDGYSWKKYGQKDILGAKYPRSYYRCTYRLMHNCGAMKQVQRSDDDPDVFEVTYNGVHTCNQDHISDPKSESLQRLQPDRNSSHNYQALPPNDKLLNMKASLRFDTKILSTTEMAAHDSFLSPIIPALDDDSGVNSCSSQAFDSPVTPDSEAFHQMRSIHGEVPNATTLHGSTTTEGVIFPIYDLPVDPNFLFDIMGFPQ